MSDSLYLTLVLVLLAALILGVLEVRRRFGWAWGGLAAVGGMVVFLFASSVSMCGCGIPNLPGFAPADTLKDEMKVVLKAERRAYDSAGRYLPIDSLGDLHTTVGHFTLKYRTDTSFRLLGSAIAYPEHLCGANVDHPRETGVFINCGRNR